MARGSPIEIDKFRGINNVCADEELVLGELRKAVNVDITNRFKLRSRAGNTQLAAGRYHSLWAPFGAQAGYVVKEDTLYSVDADGEMSALTSGLTLNAPMSYTEVNLDVYYSNGHQLGKVVRGVAVPWGIPVPDKPNLAVGPGALPPGDYQVCVVYADASGEQSGASLATYRMLVATAGFVVSDIEYPVPAVEARVFMTPANGDVFYEVARTTETEVSITRFTADVPLDTQHLLPPEPATIVRGLSGRVYMVRGATMERTEPLAYGLINPTNNFYMFPTEPTLVEEIDAGLIIVADRTYLLTREGPGQEQRLDPVSESTAVAGTGVQVDARYLGEGEHQGMAAVWLGGRGYMVAYPDGQVAPLTEDKVSFPVSETGAMGFVRRNGLAQLVTTLKDPNDETQTFNVGDRVTAEVYRNGILI